ncbi:hypothetical protein [Algoriphagus aquimarinus]|uniref:hypothetical protein n=1 Tax=Algoriphagus aquimarinus TaxID=237018 RepID=UPI0030D8A232|tara:strand:- start:54065 stop:54304 length:240 start_codon:yes stop_codon:yes gene_type:complete
MNEWGFIGQVSLVVLGKSATSKKFEQDVAMGEQDHFTPFLFLSAKCHGRMQMILLIDQKTLQFVHISSRFHEKYPIHEG